MDMDKGSTLTASSSQTDPQKWLNFLTHKHERFVGPYLNNTLEAEAISLKLATPKEQTVQDQRKQEKTNRYF